MLVSGRASSSDETAPVVVRFFLAVTFVSFARLRPPKTHKKKQNERKIS